MFVCPIKARATVMSTPASRSSVQNEWRSMYGMRSSAMRYGGSAMPSREEQPAAMFISFTSLFHAPRIDWEVKCFPFSVF